MTLAAGSGTATRFSAQDAPASFRFDADIQFDEGTHRFGMLLRADPEKDTAYLLEFDPAGIAEFS